MIMTKEKARELTPRSSIKRTGLSRDTELPEGSYTISNTRSATEIRKLAAATEADYFVTGMIIPADKAEAVCQLLQDEHGRMPSPVVVLKKEREAETGSVNRLSLFEAKTERTPAMTGHELPSMRIKDLEIIPGRHEVRVKGKTVTLTYSEFRILQTLASHPGWVFDRSRIIHAVHGDDYNCTERAVDVQVTGLRRKLGSAGAYIQTVRGVGYRFVD